MNAHTPHRRPRTHHSPPHTIGLNENRATVAPLPTVRPRPSTALAHDTPVRAAVRHASSFARVTGLAHSAHACAAGCSVDTL
eukprot:4264347-Prymnesium_polylepis.1